MWINLYTQLTKVEWVSLLASALVGYFVLSRMLRKQPEQEKIVGLLFSAGLLLLFVWKLSPLLFVPAAALDSSLHLFSFLLSAGTEEGFYLGLAVAILLIRYRLKQQRMEAALLYAKLPFAILAGFATYALLHTKSGRETSLLWGIHVDGSQLAYHPVQVYQVVICLIWFLLLIRREKAGKPLLLAPFWIGFSMSQLILGLFIYAEVYWLGLTLTQWFYLISAGCCAWFSPKQASGPLQQ